MTLQWMSPPCQLGASDAAAVGPAPPAGKTEDVLQAARSVCILKDKMGIFNNS